MSKARDSNRYNSAMRSVLIVVAIFGGSAYAAPPDNAIVTLPMLESDVLFAAFSRDGRRFVAGEELGGVTIWDVNTGTLVRDLTFTEPLPPPKKGEDFAVPPPGTLFVGGMTQAVAISHDGSMAAAAHEWGRYDPNQIPSGLKLLGIRARTWRIQDGRELANYDNHRQRIRAMTFNPAATLVSTLDDSFRLAVWESRTGRERMAFGGGDQIGQAGPFESGRACFDVAGTHAASTLSVVLPNERAEPPTLRLWDVHTCKMRSIVAPPELGGYGFSTVTVFPDGRFAAARIPSGIMLFPFDKTKPTRRISLAPSIAGGGFEPNIDGSHFLGWGGYEGLWLIRASDGHVQAVPRKVTGRIRAVCWLKDRALVASGGYRLPDGPVLPGKRDPISFWSIPVPLP